MIFSSSTPYTDSSKYVASYNFNAAFTDSDPVLDVDVLSLAVFSSVIFLDSDDGFDEVFAVEEDSVFEGGFTFEEESFSAEGVLSEAK